MVKAQVKGFGMQSDTQPGHWSGSQPVDGTWSKVSPEPTTAIKTTQSQPLKRSRSSMSTMDQLPEIPRLSGDIILEVFTHRSIRFAGAPSNEEYGDNDRLALLGEKAFNLAITDAMFRKRPMLKADELDRACEEAGRGEAVEEWVVGYKLRDKLRFSRDAADNIRDEQETRHLFFSYVGAVYAQQGVQPVLNWIGSLVDPDFEPADPQFIPMDTSSSFSFKKLRVEPQQQYMPQTPPPAFNNQQFAVPDPQQFAAPTPPPPANPPPPLPHNPLSPAQPQAAFLPLFNQTATQRRLAVEYPATFAGPAHAGRWNVKCIVNGIPKGEGTGPSKQLAKEEAARQAYYAMGWAPRAL